MGDPVGRLKDIQNANKQDGLRLIYKWVKTGVINFDEFYFLINNVSAI
jgi:hypothetical protein